MNDTSPHIEAQMIRMMSMKTPFERVRMASSMYQTAKIIAAAGIRNECGDISEAELRGKLFLRFYRDCFTDAQIRKIAAAIPNMKCDI